MKGKNAESSEATSLVISLFPLGSVNAQRYDGGGREKSPGVTGEGGLNAAGL